MRAVTAKGSDVDHALKEYLVKSFVYNAVERGATWVPLEDPDLIAFLDSQDLDDFNKRYDSALLEARWLGKDSNDSLFAIPIVNLKKDQLDPKWVDALVALLAEEFEQALLLEQSELHQDSPKGEKRPLKQAIKQLLRINDNVKVSDISRTFLMSAIMTSYSPDRPYDAQQKALESFVNAFRSQMGTNYPSALQEIDQRDFGSINYRRESVALNGAYIAAEQGVRGSILNSFSQCKNSPLESSKLEDYIIRILDKKLNTGRLFLQRCLDVIAPDSQNPLSSYPTFVSLIKGRLAELPPTSTTPATPQESPSSSGGGSSERAVLQARFEGGMSY